MYSWIEGRKHTRYSRVLCSSLRPHTHTHRKQTRYSPVLSCLGRKHTRYSPVLSHPHATAASFHTPTHLLTTCSRCHQNTKKQKGFEGSGDDSMRVGAAAASLQGTPWPYRCCSSFSLSLSLSRSLSLRLGRYVLGRGGIGVGMRALGYGHRHAGGQGIDTSQVCSLQQCGGMWIGMSCLCPCLHIPLPMPPETSVHACTYLHICLSTGLHITDDTVLICMCIPIACMLQDSFLPISYRQVQWNRLSANVGSSSRLGTLLTYSSYLLHFLYDHALLELKESM